MTDQNNQGQKIRLHKNERHSATQVDAGGLPIVPVNTGKNYYTENTGLLPNNFERNIDEIDPELIAIKITGATLAKLYSGINIGGTDPLYLEPDFGGIGLWFDKRTETGSFLLDFYFAVGISPFTKYQFAKTVLVDVTDIDKSEEMIFHLQNYRAILPAGPLPSAIIITIRLGPGYQNEHPIQIGTQTKNPVDISLIKVNMDATTITQTGNYPGVIPMIRLYPSIGRSIQIADAEGNSVKPGCPFDQMLFDTDRTVAGDNSPVRQLFRLESGEFGLTGAPRGGRIKKIRFEITGGSSGFESLVIRIKRTQQAERLGNIQELWVGDISPPYNVDFTAAIAANYFEYRGAHLSKQGVNVGLIAKNITSGDGSQIYKIEETMEVIAGILTPVTRIWCQIAQNGGTAPLYELAPFGLNDQVRFYATGFSSTGRATPYKEWLVDIPYQIKWTTTPNFFIPYEVYVLNPGQPVDVNFRMIVHVEENNILTSVNPANSIAGSEDLDRKW